ncbi:PH domain-containing protein [Massilia oculi]|uniref:PH domain-containing protein n=1 Tax=Massilia hydrophila TaxID=3044279 RepID=A0ABS7YH37_9BURK|nr:PH domain-containing protein [Massilia oculi]MCA1858322.1 PH domain-containing protein [Massilia oculi]
MARIRPPAEAEANLWAGAPSFVTFLPVLVLCVPFVWLLFPIPVLVYYWLQWRTTRYALTSQRMRVTSGVLSRRVEEVELFRVRDIELHASFVERLCGVATLRIHSNDRTAPTLAFEGIARAAWVKEALRERVLVLRETKRRIV